MESSSLADLFRDFMQRFDEFARMESDWPLFRSGEEFFGLDHPPVIKYLQVPRCLVSFLVFFLHIYLYLYLYFLFCRTSQMLIIV